MDGSAGLGRDRFALWRGKPEWIDPMLPSASEPRALAGDWVWEPELSGTRCLVWTDEGHARIRDAAGRALDASQPELVHLLSVAVRGDTILDGVITRDALFLFDCLYYEGASLLPLPLAERKSVLRDAVWFCERIRLTPSRSGPDALHGAEASGATVAGAVAKRLGGSYASGRTNDWLAFACAQAQEFVIGGYTVAADDAQAPVGLLIGYYEDGRLRYAGRVSAAYDPGSFAAVLPTLARLRRRTSPFGGAVPGGGRIQWVSPALVAQVGFSTWTPAGMPKLPRFIGLRHDREPDEVRRAAAR
jgi:bifunctional non-homologous end joining protein LigD